MTKFIKPLLIFLGAIAAGSIVYYIFSQTKNPQNITPSQKAIFSPSPNQTKAETEFTFIIAGDAMFGRYVYAKNKNNLINAFENLGEGFFKNKDLAILNLEGPIVDSEFMPDLNPENLIMKFPPQTKDVLSWLGINAVSLANNHTDNQGQKYLDYTREILTKIGITACGSPQNKTDLVNTFYKEQKQISLIALNILANSPEIDSIIQEEKNKGAFVIVFPHWGSEYQTTHNQKQENLAHSWIDEGADMVVGSHPHVIQDAETYRGRPIFYSLGNFLFDQSFSKNTQRGLILNGVIKNHLLSIELIPIISDPEPKLLENPEKEEIINKLKTSLDKDPNEKTIEFELN